MNLSLLVAVLVLCQLSGSRTENISAIAGVSINIFIQCSITESPVFWIINGCVYGFLQIPRDYAVCNEMSCPMDTLTIPVVQQEMNGHTFQCVSINCINNTSFLLGQVTLLTVSPLQHNSNAPVRNGTFKRDVLELYYPEFGVGAENTSIGWRYSSLTCQPAVFTLQGYADRNTIMQDTPTLTLNTTSSPLTFPTNSTHGALYWRLLAHEHSGTPCARDSALKYYQLDTSVTSPTLVSPSSDGEVCVPIPVESGAASSSLEVVWPERHDTVGRLCYCPPFEGEQHLFSRCISTTSCDTDYSIRVSNGSVCFAGLSPPPASIPLYFTLLHSCTHHRCLIRSTLALFTIVLAQTETNTSEVIFQLQFSNATNCAEWNEVERLERSQEIGRELAVFVRQRCGGRCEFSPSSITSPQFTCHSDAHHVTYRASVGVSTVGVSREELEAALEEWPRTHRSILLQGQRLSVEQNCPVLITSFDEETCNTNMDTTITVTTGGTTDSCQLCVIVPSVAVVSALLTAAALAAILLCILACRKKTVISRSAINPLYASTPPCSEFSQDQQQPRAKPCSAPQYEDIVELRRMAHNGSNKVAVVYDNVGVSIREVNKGDRDDGDGDGGGVDGSDGLSLLKSDLVQCPEFVSSTEEKTPHCQ